MMLNLNQLKKRNFLLKVLGLLLVLITFQVIHHPSVTFVKVFLASQSYSETIQATVGSPGAGENDERIHDTTSSVDKLDAVSNVPTASTSIYTGSPPPQVNISVEVSSSAQKPPQEEGCRVHVPGWIHPDSNVIIVMDFARRDRLGSLMGRVFKLSLLAHTMGYNFCVYSKSRQPYCEELGIPVCPDGQGKNCGHFLFVDVNMFDTLKPGFYHYKERGNSENQLKLYESSALFHSRAKSEEFRQFWRKNILASPTRGAFANSSVANQNLFSNGNKTTIAVHIRRGDKTWALRRDVFVKDAVYIQIIQQLRNIINFHSTRGLLGPPEVHIFSEDYGTVNWTSFQGIVDEFHLAPNLNEHHMDWELNIRDWVHLLKADITVTSNTFSFYPSHFKDDPDSKTGLPFNIQPCHIGGPYHGCNGLTAFQTGAIAKYTGWTEWDPSANDTVVTLENLPIAWREQHDINQDLLSSVGAEQNTSKFKVLPYMESEQEHLYIDMIHKFPPVPSGKKYVISYGIYGDNPKYISGAMSNMELAPTYFPGWEMRFYYDETVPKEAIDKLNSMGANMVFRPETFKGGKSMGMFWRFLVADDETVDRFLIRDADSRLNARERFAVEEWIQSNKTVHMVRDHPNHYAALNGGLWGGSKGCLNGTLMEDLAKDFINAKGNDAIDYGTDVSFLLQKVLPIVMNEMMQHDAYFCWKYGGNGFPTKRDKNWQHVGQVFNENDQPITKHMRKLKNPNPEKCRRQIDWIYG